MSATKEVVHKLINRDLLEYRFDKFINLKENITKNDLNKYDQKPPYYCHYLSWILGTWQDETLISFFDSMIGIASKIPGWKNEKKLLTEGTFKNFYSLIWQLQIATFLKSNSKISELKWQGGGSDFIFNIGDDKYFLECYVFFKSFITDLFLEEVFNKIDPRIKIYHQIYQKKLSIKDEDEFYNSIFSIINDSIAFNNKLNELNEKHPVILKSCEDLNLYIYLEGKDLDKYDPSVLPSGGRCVIEYATTMINEAINNKYESNNLKFSRPNILAINFISSYDLQTIISHTSNDGFFIDTKTNNFDNIILFNNGIDNIPNIDRARILKGNMKIFEEE